MIKVTATMNSVQTPHTLGYRWPAEWERHAATWISWPHNRATWPDRFQRVPECFATIIRTLAQYEPVQVLSGGEPVMDEAQKMVGDLANVTLHDIPTNDAWIRDYGPTFIQAPGSREVAAIDWQFNSWGGKYPPWDLDNTVPEQITQQLGMRRFPVDVVMEGGSIDGNGRGAILTTQSCLLDSQRNAGMHRQQMERILLQYCSASEVIWIAGGPMAGDDTDGHVDQLARFVSPNQIVVAVEDDPQDENYQRLHTNLRVLESCRDQWPEPLEIITLPMPHPIYFDQQRVPASYCNFYIANGCVLVPLFDDPADDEACQILEPLFPGRTIIGLAARDLAWGLGAFHCLTQQQPAGVMGCGVSVERRIEGD